MLAERGGENGQQGSSEGVSAGYRGQIGKRSAWPHAVAHTLECKPGNMLVTETSAPLWGYNAERQRGMIISEPTDKARRMSDHPVAAQPAALPAPLPGG